MQYFFQEKDRLKKLAGKKNIFLFLDYDGTLTPIVKTPPQALLSPAVRGLLARLNRQRRCRVAIVSGRSLANIKSMVRLEGIIYVGNHGLEVEGAGLRPLRVLPWRFRQVLKELRKRLTENTERFKGVFVEDKGLTLSLHYRLASQRCIPEIKKAFDEVLRLPVAAKKVKVTRGKKVFEIRPPVNWDKGAVVAWLLNQKNVLSSKGPCLGVYVGDDTTDEAAFAVLRKRGVGIGVGKTKNSHAKFYLKDHREVYVFLKQLLEVVHG
ncbi:MAG: trehalose-phosphatase [Candidatus Omnitrophota bacterium]